MKLSFDTITLGGGPNWTLEDYPDLSASLENISIEIPGTDYSKMIGDFLKPVNRKFSGTLLGNDPLDYRNKKQYLTNLIRQVFTFTIQDTYRENSGALTTYQTLEFEGKLVSIEVEDMGPYVGKYQIQIFSEDPLFYYLNEITGSATVANNNYGFSFPATFPFMFGYTGNLTPHIMTFNNTGKVDVYPTINMWGSFDDVSIKTSNDRVVDDVFEYNDAIPTGEKVTITAHPTDPIKVRDWDGLGVMYKTNSNFEALKIIPGVNVWEVYTSGDTDTNSLVTVNFKPALYSL